MHVQVANAVGAALSQVSGSVDLTVDLMEMSRDEAIRQGTAKATHAAIQAGADNTTIKVATLTVLSLLLLLLLLLFFVVVVFLGFL